MVMGPFTVLFAPASEGVPQQDTLLAGQPQMRTLLASLFRKSAELGSDLSGIVTADSELGLNLSATPEASIGRGLAVINSTAEGDDRLYWFETLVPLDILPLFAPPDVTDPRIDLVIVQVTDLVTGAAEVQVLEGVPDPSPSPPVTPSNALALYEVTIPANAADPSEWGSALLAGYVTTTGLNPGDIDSSDYFAPSVVTLPALAPDVFYAFPRGTPYHFVGTWDEVTEYLLGEAVRWDADFPNQDWQLYTARLRVVGAGTVPSDSGSWQKATDIGLPVIIEGTANPNTFGEQLRITHYTHNATGGVFHLGSATGIAWDATQAAIQAALDAEYGAGKTAVVGDAANFTVEYFMVDVLDFDDTDLTGGGLTLQENTQARIVGGFAASDGSTYIPATDAPTTLQWSSDDETWLPRFRVSSDSAGDKNLEIAFDARRTGPGDGGAFFQASVIRRDTGVGNAEGVFSASVLDTATGTAIFDTGASHHTGGTAKTGALANADGAFIRLGNPALFGNGGLGFKLGDLAVDPVLATPEDIYRAFVDAGAFVDGS